MSQAGSISSSGGAGSGDVLFLNGNTGGNVGPTVSGVINVIGVGNISVVGTPGSNTLTISDASEAAWILVSSNTSMSDNTGYFCVAPGGALVMTLPSTSVLGAVIEVFLDGATSFQVAQNAGQMIVYTNLVTTTGTGGSILIIGSAAGVAAMGMEKIKFLWYLKKISFLALIGYFSGALVYVLQHKLLGI